MFAQIILMHMRGTPQTMTNLKVGSSRIYQSKTKPSYLSMFDVLQQYDDVVVEVAQVLKDRIAAAEAAGIYRWNIIIDPGIGFAKARVLNLEILRRLSLIKQSCQDLPLLVDHACVSCKKSMGCSHVLGCEIVCE